MKQEDRWPLAFGLDVEADAVRLDVHAVSMAVRAGETHRFRGGAHARRVLRANATVRPPREEVIPLAVGEVAVGDTASRGLPCPKRDRDDPRPARVVADDDVLAVRGEGG